MLSSKNLLLSRFASLSIPILSFVPSSIATDAFLSTSGSVLTEDSKKPLYRHQRQFTSATTAVNMGWASTWDDILSGGSSRWKINDLSHKEHALDCIVRTANSGEATEKSLKIFCPLAGDDTFVNYAWSKGHSVTSIDLVPKAVEAMRDQFPVGAESWTRGSGPKSVVIWKHDSGRATLIEGDALADLSEVLGGAFDAVYDKDSFGALDKSMRDAYCDRIGKYTKKEAVIYLEVKLRSKDHPNRNAGPPFSLERDELMMASNFGSDFVYEQGLGEVFELGSSMMKQTGHILRRS